MSDDEGGYSKPEVGKDEGGYKRVDRYQPERHDDSAKKGASVKQPPQKQALLKRRGEI